MDKKFTPKIFLVDDDVFCLTMNQQYLSNLGYKNIHTFYQSAECLNQLTQQPDIIFLDYHMDNLNGIDVLKKIKRFNPNTIIVFISGQEDIDIAVNALKYGAFDYIMKNQLNEEKMRQVMTKAGQLRELLNRKNRKGILKRVFSGLGL